MKHKTSIALFTYWNDIRGSRVAPRRFEIEPSRISAVLPDTFILDCSDAGAFRFRLAGTRMSNLLGRDVRDSDFVELFQDGDKRTVALALQQTVEQAPVSILTTASAMRVAVQDRDDVQEGGLIRHSGARIELVLLPLFHTQNTVTRLLGCAVPLDPIGPGPAAGLTSQALLGHEIIWPDGRPHAILEQLNRQSPFAPEHRLGRIVTSDRRRFRVFDGGKST